MICARNSFITCEQATSIIINFQKTEINKTYTIILYLVNGGDWGCGAGGGLHFRERGIHIRNGEQDSANVPTISVRPRVEQLRCSAGGVACLCYA